MADKSNLPQRMEGWGDLYRQIQDDLLWLRSYFHDIKKAVRGADWNPNLAHDLANHGLDLIDVLEGRVEDDLDVLLRRRANRGDAPSVDERLDRIEQRLAELETRAGAHLRPVERGTG